MRAWSLCVLFLQLPFIHLATNETGVQQHVRSLAKRRATAPVHWVITTILVPPYTMQRDPDPGVEAGNARYQGYIPDVIKRIADILEFSYTLKLVEDGKHGTSDPHTGNWTGMVGEILAKKADLAAGPLTVNEALKKVVDLTHPFMWYNAAVLLPRYYDNGKKLMLKTVDDLGNRTELTFGILRGSSTQTAIMNSESANITQLHHRIVEVESIEKGIKRVQESNGTFMLIIETDSAAYRVGRTCTCNLTKIDMNELPYRGYAIALAKDSPYTNDLNEAIRDLKDTGKLTSLQMRWWKSSCPSKGVKFRLGVFHQLVTTVLIAISLWLFTER